ncbi:MAG TPA: alpha/beta fold hydrolase [Actinomycetota bacterium]|nr:alpha/beta fold hydrolase [Actinomycetota bacterium]
MYGQQHGKGTPLVLLHGELQTIELCFGTALPTLAKQRRVIAVELQGHGRTADVQRPMTFEHLAGDVVGLLDHLGIEWADVFGFSLGGLTAYQLLIDHPERIRRAVVASVDHHNERGGEALAIGLGLACRLGPREHQGFISWRPMEPVEQAMGRGVRLLAGTDLAGPGPTTGLRSVVRSSLDLTRSNGLQRTLTNQCSGAGEHLGMTTDGCKVG